MSEAEQNHVGSSPLTRGKHTTRVHGIDDEGLIPAHAGKTITEAYAKELVEAHPRSRGENICCPRGRVRRTGSSPRTRGKLVRTGHVRPSTGLIPAHAGKTGVFCMLRCTTPAHPRSRGENRSYQARRPSPGGSSPLTRGKRRGVHPHPGRCRLIPAHAGKTVRREPRRRHTEAHPRSRGENLQACVLSEDCHGSSPLTRGKLPPQGHARGTGRLIPAHAGKTGCA